MCVCVCVCAFGCVHTCGLIRGREGEKRGVKEKRGGGTEREKGKGGGGREEGRGWMMSCIVSKTSYKPELYSVANK